MSEKTKKRISITGRIIGFISFFSLLGFISYVQFTSPRPIDIDQARVEIVAHPDSNPKRPVKAVVQQIKKVPLYGYAYYIGDNIMITNFDKLPYKVGDEVVFHITGIMEVGDAYIINVDFM